MILFFRYKFLFTAILLLILSMPLVAQETLVVGQVFDAVEKTPIANVSVWFKNTAIGIKSNEEGFFMLRTNGNQTTIVFSSVGYKSKEIKLQQGKSVGIQVELQPQNTELQEVFVLPGTNPALDLMKRVRAAKIRNNVRLNELYKAETTEQNLVLLSKVNQRGINQRIFDQLSSGSFVKNDSSLTLPLYMSEEKFTISGKNKTLINKNIYNSVAQYERIIEQLAGSFTADLNFYQPTVSLFDKEFVSPLSDIGSAFYNFFLVDSVQTKFGKEYKLHVRSKNTKNLAFNGVMLIDSATLALKFIELNLPLQANLNFVKNLHLTQNYKLQNELVWLPDSGSLSVNMVYDALSDSLLSKPIVLLKNTFKSKISDTVYASGDFAGSKFQTGDLSSKLKLINETPLFKTARWIADVLLTGYMQVGKIDVGKIQNIARVTDEEGFRLTIPLRTNENLWKDISIGGYGGYGFYNRSFSYSTFGMYKLPFGERNILKLGYTNDYRRIDYDYNDLLLRENPLVSGDEDVVNTIFAFRSSDKVSRRKEFEATYNTDINDGFEAGVSYRFNRIFSSDALSFGTFTGFNQVDQQQLTLTTRFSFGERVYNDHLFRVYATTYKPVIYSIISAGKFNIGSTKGNYAKLSSVIRQNVRFGIGQWNYALEAGAIFGKVPYLLLEIPAGSETLGYKRYQFTCMEYMEYAADKYLSMHNEFIFNGLFLNQLPVIKNLNLREMLTFKMFYGSLRPEHAQILALPSGIYITHKPYMEIGVGVSNIFKFLTLQSVWRLTDLNHPDADRWGIRSSIRVSF